jgi:hypothetical protein
MATYYIAPQTGSDSNAGTSENLPRATPPASSNGDVWLFKRGETYVRTSQLSTGAATGMTLGAYGTGEMPIITLQAASTNALNIQGDGTHFIRDLWFKDCTTNTHGRVIGFGPITGPGYFASGEITNCKFTGCNWNAIAGGATSTALASKRIVVKNCTFDNIGEDCFYGSALYLEVAYNRMTNMSTNFSDGGIGYGDGVGFLGADPDLVWIHHNYIDHSNLDTKQCIIVDTSTGAGTAIIEFNELIGFGTDAVPGITHSVVVTDCFTIARGNKIRAGGLALTLTVANSQAYGNIVNLVNSNVGSPIFAMTGNSCKVINNTFRSFKTLNANQKIVVQGALVSNGVVQNNVFVNVPIAIQSDNASNNPTATYNCFYQVTTPRRDQAGAAFAGGNDITADPLLQSDGSIPASSPCATAGTYVSGVTLANGRLRPNFTPIGAYMAVLPRTARV